MSVLRAQAPSDDPGWGAVDSRMRRLGGGPGALIETLHAVQEAFGHLDPAALAYVSAALRVPPSRVYGVATFYSFFTLTPAGRHTCVVCTGTACHLDGAGRILAALRSRLGVEPDGTTADGEVSLLTARCVGTCSLAPLVELDGETVGRVTPTEVLDRLDRLRPPGVAAG